MPDAELLARLPPDVTVQSCPLDDGTTAHVLTRDATQRENAELRRDSRMLRETLDAIDGPVVVYSNTLVYVFGNRAYHAFYPHLPPEEVLVGKSYDEVLGLSIAAGAVSNPRAALDTAAYVAERRTAMLDRQDKISESHNPKLRRWSSVRVQWTPSGNRVSLRVDITAIKRLQQDLLNTQRMKTIGRISGGVAHNFNNLLTVISGNLEMLLDDPGLSEAGRHMAMRAFSGAEAGARLVRQLLTFARRDITQSRVLDPNTLVADMAELLRGGAGSGIIVMVELEAGVGMVDVDPAQLSDALMNLVLNAREAVEAAARGGAATGGRITITTSRSEDAPDFVSIPSFVSIRVTDNGIGMAPEVAAEAFDPFFTTKGLAVASGLGLSQVHGFAIGAGGTVTIDSTRGEGTTIDIRLPVAD